MAKNNVTDYDHRKTRSLPVPAGTKSGDVVKVGADGGKLVFVTG